MPTASIRRSDLGPRGVERSRRLAAGRERACHLRRSVQLQSERSKEPVGGECPSPGRPRDGAGRSAHGGRTGPGDRDATRCGKTGRPRRARGALDVRTPSPSQAPHRRPRLVHRRRRRDRSSGASAGLGGRRLFARWQARPPHLGYLGEGASKRPADRRKPGRVGRGTEPVHPSASPHRRMRCRGRRGTRVRGAWRARGGRPTRGRVVQAPHGEGGSRASAGRLERSDGRARLRSPDHDPRVRQAQVMAPIGEATGQRTHSRGIIWLTWVRWNGLGLSALPRRHVDAPRDPVGPEVAVVVRLALMHDAIDGARREHRGAAGGRWLDRHRPAGIVRRDRSAPPSRCHRKTACFRSSERRFPRSPPRR